jgi:hypothetical protein
MFCSVNLVFNYNMMWGHFPIMITTARILEAEIKDNICELSGCYLISKGMRKI